MGRTARESYSATYNAGQDFAANPNVCLAAVH